MAELDQLNVSTLKYIRKTPALLDNFFQVDPLIAYLKLNVKEAFSGGALIQENFFGWFRRPLAAMRVWKTSLDCLGC